MSWLLSCNNIRWHPVMSSSDQKWPVPFMGGANPSVHPSDIKLTHPIVSGSIRTDGYLPYQTGAPIRQCHNDTTMRTYLSSAQQQPDTVVKSACMRVLSGKIRRWDDLAIKGQMRFRREAHIYEAARARLGKESPKTCVGVLVKDHNSIVSSTSDEQRCIYSNSLSPQPVWRPHGQFH